MAASPVLSRRSLGAELRRLREEAKVTAALAAKELDCSVSKISRIETGVTAPRRPEIESLVRLYDAESRRDHLVQLAGESKQAAWYDEYSDLLEPNSVLHRYIGLEGGASQLRLYASQWLPGLLQTEEFMRAVYASTRSDRDKADVDRLVRYRLDRQQVLRRPPTPLHLCALLDESVIRRPAHGAGVMTRQLEYLSSVIDDGPSHIEIKLLPFDAGLHGLLGSEFTLMSFEGDEDDLAFFESQDGALFQEKPEVVRLYADRWEGAWAKAMEGSELAVYLREAAATFT